MGKKSVNGEWGMRMEYYRAKRGIMNFFLIDWISSAVFENNMRFYAIIGEIEKIFIASTK